MTTDQFWELIAESRRGVGPADRAGKLEHQCRRMKQRAGLPPKEILEYERIFGTYYFAAYRYDLWAAAYVIWSGCSD